MQMKKYMYKHNVISPNQSGLREVDTVANEKDKSRCKRNAIYLIYVSGQLTKRKGQGREDQAVVPKQRN